MRKAESGGIVSFCRSSRWTHIEIHFSQVAPYSCLPPVETRRHHSKAHGAQQFYSSFTAPGDSLLDGLVFLCSPCASPSPPTLDGRNQRAAVNHWRESRYMYISRIQSWILCSTLLSLYILESSVSHHLVVYILLCRLFREEPSWQGEFSLSSTACRSSFRLKWRLEIILFFWK